MVGEGHSVFLWPCVEGERKASEPAWGISHSLCSTHNFRWRSRPGAHWRSTIRSVQISDLWHACHRQYVHVVVLHTMLYIVSLFAWHEDKSCPILSPYAITELTLLSQPVFVYREDKNSRQNTVAELKRRAHSNGRWPQFLIFPEGTTTNGKALISFKPGAFIPSMPVQPVLIRYPDCWVSATLHPPPSIRQPPSATHHQPPTKSPPPR